MLFGEGAVSVRFFFIVVFICLCNLVFSQESRIINGYHIVSDTLYDQSKISQQIVTDTVFNGMKAAVYYLDGPKHFTYFNETWNLDPFSNGCISSVSSYSELRTLSLDQLCSVVFVDNFPDTVNGVVYEILGGVFVRDTTGVEDYGTIIKSNTSGYAFRRKHNGVLIPDWWENKTDSKKIQAAVDLSSSYGKIQFVPRTYIVDNDIYIDSLQHIHFDGQKATLKAADGSARNTTLSAAYSESSYTIEVSSIPSSWVKGDILVLAINNTNEGTSGRSQIDSIVGNTVYLKFPFTSQFGGNFPSAPVGTNVIKNLTFFRGRPSATEGTTATEGANKGIIIENFIFDGNKQNGNTVSLSWSVNNMIMLHGRGTEIRSCRFINAPSEVISGHGMNVHDNVFRDCNGSVLHLSAHDLTFEESYPAYFINNTVINCNTTPYQVSGHNEGLISYSWNGGYVIVNGNYFVAGSNSTGVLGSLQGYGSPNDREIVILSNNYCKGFDYIVFGSHQTTTRSLEIIGNIFEDCINLMPTLKNNSSVKICGNVQVGSTNFGIDFRNSCEYQNILDQSLGYGKNSLLQTTTYNNTAFGHYSLEQNVNGNFNTAVGEYAGRNQTIGDKNTLVGTWVGANMLSGNENTVVGFWARSNSQSGDRNVHVGSEAGRTNTGSGNVFIGADAGRWVQGDNNLIIHNNDSALPLIEGKFDEGLSINGNLKVNGSNFLRLPRLSDTDRDALLGLLGGEMIFNVSISKLQVYDGVNWVDLN